MATKRDIENAPNYDAPPPETDHALIAAAESGNHLNTLYRVRDKLARELADERGFHAGPLARELREVLREITALSPPEKVKDTADDLAQARADRLARAHNANRPAV